MCATKKDILVAYNHGLIDPASEGHDAFYDTRVTKVTEDSISVNRPESEYNYVGDISGTIDRHSGHGELVEYKRQYRYDYKNNLTKNREWNSNYIVECSAAPPVKF